MARPDHIEEVLRAGGEKARRIAKPLMTELRRAVGLRDLREQTVTRTAEAAKKIRPEFKQYREKDGRFHFKLVDGEGQELLGGGGFDSPRDAGVRVARLKLEGASDLREEEGGLWLGDVRIGVLAPGISLEAAKTALRAFVEEGA